MKTKITLFSILLLAFVLPGCVYSLYPLYTSKDLIFEKKLVGLWRSPENETWKFENLLEQQLEQYKDKTERAQKEKDKKPFINKNTYLLSSTEKGETRKMQAHLIKLGENLFLDIFPESINLKNSFYEDQFVPIHTYARIKVYDNRFELYFFNAEFLYKLLDQNTIRIKHESFEYYKVITASTEELQKFVIKYGDQNDFFMKPVVFNKSAQ